MIYAGLTAHEVANGFVTADDIRRFTPRLREWIQTHPTTLSLYDMRINETYRRQRQSGLTGFVAWMRENHPDELDREGETPLPVGDVSNFVSPEAHAALWAELGRLADQHSLCALYDDTVRRLGGVQRTVQRRVTVQMDLPRGANESEITRRLLAGEFTGLIVQREDG